MSVLFVYKKATPCRLTKSGCFFLNIKISVLILTSKVVEQNVFVGYTQIV